MSALCGIVHLDGRPVEEVQIRAMVEAAADRSPDSSRSRVQGNVGFGFGALHTVPELSRSQQPLEDAASGVWSLFAGRVDNREELGSWLESAGCSGPGESDAALVLRSYLCWREGCLSRILGEFSVAIWDPSRQHLFCARDLVGTKPFYYCQTQMSFYFATEIRQLLAVSEVPRRPNEGMLGEYLVSRMATKRETQFESILRLPPATFLLVESDRFEEKEYWDPAAVPELHYKKDNEYAEHLRELLWQAVRTRLRSDDPVGIQLSGGVDSSSLVAVAADLARSRDSACPELRSFSLVFPGWDCDESHFIDAVAAETGITTHRVVQEPVDGNAYSQLAARYCDYPDYPNGTMSDPLEMAAQDRGVRVLLTGLGGDEWFQRPDFHIADLLRRGRIVEAIRWAQSIPATSWWPLRHHPLYAEGILPLIPESIKTRLRRQRSIAETANWIDRSFAGRNSLEDRLRQPLDWQPFGSLARAAGFRAATQGFQAHALEMEERSAASFHLELRYPFHDRRVVEFGLGLPPDQRWRHGLHKHVLREAMRGHLPERVRQRNSKAEFSRVFVEALLAIGRDTFDRLGIAEAGWVDGRVVLGMFDKMEQRYRTESLTRGPELWPLWSVFGTELLYREVFNRNGSGD